MIAIHATLHALGWFVAGWMCSGGFTRIGFAIFRRTKLKAYLASEWAILSMPFRPLEEILE